MDRLTVLLAEDHAVVREGMREMIERDPGISVIGEAADGAAAVALAAEFAPDLVLLDLGLPVLNGLEAARRIRQLPRPPRILMLSAYDDDDYVVAAIEAGANGYLLKTAHMKDIIAAIRSVALGEVVLDPAVARKLIGRSTQPATTGDVLSARELQVLRHAARGARTKEIGNLLSVSTRTVEAHFTSIFNKLGVSSRTEAIVHAASRGWLVLERDWPLQ
ncbi:MAG TPA: response regulator transcription factor [Candidatus Sulfomarinibacteraceae bacterium]|nr:response regulator transcription factor [Candidatus Sulfomarinibacteraceae bacterium]